MLRIISLILISAFLQSCFTVHSNPKFIYSKLTPLQYSTRLQQSNNYYIIDVRTPAEYSKGHIKNAININFLELNFGKRTDSLDRSRDVFIYCHTCHRSPSCARILKRKGFVRVIDMRKGFSNWISNNLPVDTGAVMH